MFKVDNIVKIHPISNETKLDEFQIKTVPRLELPVLRIDKGVITDHVDFSSMKKNKKIMNICVRVYSKRLAIKYKSFIKHVYDHLIVKELNQLRLTVEEAKVSDLILFKTCAKCKKTCYQIKDSIKCCSCDYWIHDNIQCYSYDLKHGKICPACYHNQMSIVEDDNNQR